jgi:hypothetical protein
MNVSWSLNLLADRRINERDLVRVLSDEDISTFPKRQAWGWPSSSTGLGVDVDLPRGKSLRICGADFSAHLAEGAARGVAAGLRKFGYRIRVGTLEY